MIIRFARRRGSARSHNKVPNGNLLRLPLEYMHTGEETNNNLKICSSGSSGIKSGLTVRRSVAGAVASILLFSSAACGIGTYNAGDSEPTRAYDLSNLPTDPDLAAQVPQSIAQDGLLTVGSDLTYAPAEFLAGDGQSAQGYDIDIARAIAKVLGLTPQIASATFSTIIPATGTKYDIGISAFTITPERIDAVNFVSYFMAGMTFSVQKGNPHVFDVNQLCGTTVAVEIGTAEQTQIEADSAACVKAGKPAIAELPFTEQADATMAVVTGRADAMFTDSPVAGYAATQTGDQVERFGDDQQVAAEGIAVAKNDMVATKVVQAAVQKLIDDGTYGEILKFWGVESGAVEKAEINGGEE
jgi:polar amino acid transport system substrate-binding protein